MTKMICFEKLVAAELKSVSQRQNYRLKDEINSLIFNYKLQNENDVLGFCVISPIRKHKQRLRMSLPPLFLAGNETSNRKQNFRI